MSWGTYDEAMTDSTPEALEPTIGQGVLHLFMRPGSADAASVELAVKAIAADETQVVPVALLGHKADLAFMLLHRDVWKLRKAQTALAATGLELVESYVSLTETSEYDPGTSEARRNARLWPTLPIEGKTAWCFYPMSKRRNIGQNWYSLSFDERKNLMSDHGVSGRKFAGRVTQFVTGSTGLDEYEWGVTLFAVHPDDLKEVVYTMRYDEASAIYGEFGPFYTGMVAELATVLDQVGIA